MPTGSLMSTRLGLQYIHTYIYIYQKPLSYTEQPELEIRLSQAPEVQSTTPHIATQDGVELGLSLYAQVV